MIKVRQEVRRLANKVKPAAGGVTVRPARAKSRGGSATPLAAECSDTAPPTCDPARRQVLALWWIVRLASDAPEPEITDRVASFWRQASGSAEPFQRWRQLVDAVEAAVAEPARQTAWLLAGRGMVPRDRNALALILGGHEVADVAYLEQIPVRDVHRRLRTGLTSLGPAPLPASNERDNQKSPGIAPPVVGPRPRGPEADG